MIAKEKGLYLTVVYSVIQCFLWMGYASILGFASVYLLDAGFTNTQIGMLSAASCLVSAILQPTVASYADKPQSPSVKLLLTGIAGLLMVFAALLLAVRGSRMLTALFFGLCTAALLLLTPLVNSLGTETLNQGKHLSFGIARGIGSAGYGVGAFLLGRLEGPMGAVVVPVSILVIYGCFLLGLMAFPFRKVPRAAAQAERKGGVLSFFTAYRRFTWVLAGCILLYCGHTLINSFTFQIVDSKGGGSEELGTIMSICALVELPTMFLFGLFRRWKGAGFWLKIAGIFMTLKILGTLLVPNMTLFYPVQFLQILGWALIAVSTVYYANSQMEPQDEVKGQAYMTMAYTVGTVLGNLVGGPLIDLVGVSIMLAIATAISGLGMVTVLAKAGSGEAG